MLDLYFGKGHVRCGDCLRLRCFDGVLYDARCERPNENVEDERNFVCGFLLYRCSFEVGSCSLLLRSGVS